MPREWTVPEQLAIALKDLSPNLEAPQGVVVVVDVRSLGGINVRYGRNTGDRVLAALDRSLRRRLLHRVARLPGDQFLVVHGGSADIPDVRRQVERATRVVVLVRPWRPVWARVHLGVASWHDAETAYEAVLKAAQECQRAADMIRATRDG